MDLRIRITLTRDKIVETVNVSEIVIDE